MSTAAQPKSKAKSKPTGKGKPSTIKPKAPRSTEERLKRLFISLTAQIEGGHYKNAVKTCNKILILAPGDAEVVQTKLFLLLQTEQYAAALELAAPGAFEKAYALYRLNREDDASAVLNELKTAPDVDEDVARSVEHLEAQLQYRSGDYANAVSTYTHLLDSCAPQSDEQSDLLTNLSAAQAHLDFLTSGFQSALHPSPATLEAAPPPSAPHAVPSVAVDASAAPAKPKRTGPRPGRVPKGVVPGVTPPPDPERWIKKSERTNVPVARNRRGKKVVGAAGTTQGSSAPEQPAQQQGGGGKKKKR
ncbi:hypothetical protein AURDEDRAFT_107687 [Auricularia subglabra TFB-10046 SS5]|nr:hypothetical protein AURDEDRAFT_107687 [Auricularia subglabra TFB-10046 SS5]